MVVSGNKSGDPSYKIYNMVNQETDILLVEDNPIDAQLVFKALKKNNLDIKIEHVEDGAEALDFLFARGRFSSNLKRKRPKLVLLDLKLPKMDGIQVLEEIRANKKTQTIPVVVMTTSRETSDITECYKMCANSYLVKPVDFSEFSGTVMLLCQYWLKLNVSLE